jgi:hypothetical protein
MVNFDVNELTHRAAIFRASIVALIQRDPKALGVTFESFPSGSCGDASYLLAKYFQDHQCGKFYYVSGQLGTQSHAWLARHELIVDITADQFEHQNPVTVTENHVWYLQFALNHKELADFELCEDGWQKARLMGLYKRIVGNIPTGVQQGNPT